MEVTLRGLGVLRISAPKLPSPWWDVVALVLSLSGGWLLAGVGIPDVLYPLLLGSDGVPLMGPMGRPLMGKPDQYQLAMHARYMWAAIPAMCLVTVGFTLQIRHSLYVICCSFGKSSS
ncbi:hypothetical protein [Acidisphaera sp. L21]|uniref:hypothetical protein n=1 Tax=Acidisphaera sp. L21 TaxID=1641851 RepID=UPI00131B57B5|nr:hypothetical protein [Acidisphaera sp. L21]